MVAKTKRYEEGADVTEILEGKLFLGNLASAQSLQCHLAHGVTHIISVCPEFTAKALLSAYSPQAGHEGYTCPATSRLPPPPKYLQIPVDDSEYEDILIHLPKACQFIEEAIADGEASGQGGRVLVHCVMGISRSVSVVAAYLMKSRGMSPAEALGYVKHRRPQIHPNYGFLKQLQVFVQCSYEPSKFNQVYGSWKRRQKQDVTKYLGYFEDISCLAGGGVGMGVGGGGCQNGGGSSDDDGRGRILLCSNLPKDQDQTDSILSTLGITHLLSLSPAGIVSTILSSDKHKPPSSSPSCFAVVAPRKVKHHHIDLGSGRDDHIPPDVYAGVLKESVGWIQRALASTSASNVIDKKPLVLVHSTVESRVCEVVGAWLMESTGISTKEAVSTMEEALPLFEPTKSLVRNLGAFEKYIATITRATTTNSALSPPPAYIVNLRSVTPIPDASVGGLVKEFRSMSVTRQIGSPRVNR